MKGSYTIEVPHITGHGGDGGPIIVRVTTSADQETKETSVEVTVSEDNLELEEFHRVCNIIEEMI